MYMLYIATKRLMYVAEKNSNSNKNNKEQDSVSLIKGSKCP